MALSFPEAVRVVENDPEALGVSDPYGYIANLKAFLRGQPDDARVAVLIAVDAAKSLIGVGGAFFLALAAFILLFRFTETLLFLVISTILTVVSVATGLLAIGTAYRRGQQPADLRGAPWSTKPFGWLLGVQSLTGVLALAFFAVAVVAWHGGGGNTTTTQFRALQDRIDSVSARVDQQAATLIQASRTQEVPAVQPPAPAPSIVPQLTAIATSLDQLKAAIPRQITVNVAQTAPAPQGQANSRAKWIRVQEALAHRGYWIGDVDGIPGERTRKVIRAYQRTIPAPRTGYLTPEQADQLLARR
jgi:peptidoglycan hydrolase-like protein with peptidoglycan-binding domain